MRLTDRFYPSHRGVNPFTSYPTLDPCVYPPDESLPFRPEWGM